MYNKLGGLLSGGWYVLADELSIASVGVMSCMYRVVKYLG